MNLNLEEYEKIIAYKAMTDSTYLNSISDYVKSEYFEDDNIAHYFKIVSEFYDKRKKLPTITEVKSYLNTESERQGFRQLVESFKEIDKNLNKDELYENTEKFLKERATWVKILDIAENAENKIKNPQSVLEAFDEICKINLDPEKGIEIYSDIDQVIDHILNDDNFIPTGWKWLDEALGGGYLENGKALYMFAGQANIGKSIFLGNVAANIASTGKSVLVVTLEMSEMVYAKRILSNVTKIPMRDFKEETHALRSLVEDVKESNPDSKIYIKEFPPSTITPKKLSAFIKKMKDSGVKIDAIVIDYLSLLTSTFGSNSYERVKHICEEVRAMSYEYSCPIISASQLNRSAFSKDNPGMEGLSESIGTAATADVIISIFQQEEDIEMGIIKLGMIKNRYGPRGMVQPMRINYPTLTVYQSDSDDVEYIEESQMSTLDKILES